jgi:hypothetical protein
MRAAIAAGFVAAVWQAPMPAQTQAPRLADLLNLAGVYHAEYASRVSGVTLEEQYQLRNVTGGGILSTVRIASDVVLVNANGGVAALRDVYAIDTKPTRERKPRITALLAVPAPAMSDWDTAARFPQEGAVHFALDIIVKVNEPTKALEFIALSAQRDLKYKLDGTKKINGVETVAIGFEEPAGPEKKYALGTRRNSRASGRIWVDPATGAVHQTELWVESKGESATVSVKYAPDPKLRLMLPTETNETYEERELSSGLGSSPGSGVAWLHSFQASAKYSNASLTPIDLRKLTK